MRFLFFIIVLLFAPNTASAASSDWLDVDGARIRLIGMPSQDSGAYRAGLQISLESGWKTYWRNPGSSGLPPQLNFSASKNVKNADVRLPSPSFYEEDGSIGYKGNVTFPITVTPVAKGLPMSLNVTGLLGICSDICIPTQIDISMPVGKASVSRMDVALELNTWEAKLPKAPQNDFVIDSAILNADGDKTALVKARIPAKAEKITLFAEGPLDWYLDRAKLMSRNNTEAIFVLDLSEVKKREAILGKKIIFTLVTSKGSIEQSVTIK